MHDSSTTSATPKSKPKPELSPAMRQYQQFKSQYPGYVLFFRMGDFYEMFWEDAKTAAKTLGVTLTSRNKGAEDEIPMAGVPFHAVEGYLRKMIAAGFKVAICEQMENPADAKGVIQREVVRLMTPGTLTDDPLLDGKSDNFLAAVAFQVSKSDGYKAALAWVELSTGAFMAMSGSEDQVLDEIACLRPAEILIPELPSGQPHPIGERIKSLGINAITARAGWQFTTHHAKEQLERQWQFTATEGLGFAQDDPAIIAVGAVLTYLEETQKSSLAHLRTPKRHVVEDHLAIDPASYRSLEIDRTIRSGGTEGTLLSAIDRTRSPMGARLLRQWLRFPLCDLEHIHARQSAIAALLVSPAELRAIVDGLDDVCDIERIVGRLTVGRASPRDISALSKCLHRLPKLFDLLESLSDANAVSPELASSREFCSDQATYLTGAITPDPAPHLREGGVIATGFDAELDRLRDIGTNSQQWLAKYQSRLIAETSISTLKVGYNKVFGYYIEVTESHRDKAPASWTRKQTVKNAERYITAELKDFETDALGARDKAIALEQTLFENIRQALIPHVGAFQELAYSLARGCDELTGDARTGAPLLPAERR